MRWVAHLLVFWGCVLAAVVTFTKNHWSNATGQIVQPTEIAALRK